jgi:tetratricopeptide (TPR) repeat protein
MSFNSVIFIIFTIGFSFSSIAQSERKITRKGNAQYETGNFVDAEINYKKAIEKNANLLEAEFNLGDALAKQERFDEALESFNKVSSSTEDPVLKANALHNKGNVHLSQQDLESALESYKDALRINPKDNETRYNYAYVKKLLDQQQDQEEKEQEQNEENKDNNKEDKEQKENNEEKGDQQNEDSENKDQDNPENQENENKDEQQDKGENKEDESKQEQQDKGQTDGEDAEEEKEGEQPKPKENKLSPEEAQRLLEALKQEENKVQEKMKKHKIKGAKVKIEKDW